MTTQILYYAWEDVINRLRSSPAGSIMRIPSTQIAHPLDANMVRTLGLPIGQRADFRVAIDERTAFHVRDFGGYYDAQLYSVLPQAAVEPPSVPREAPGATILGATAIGALLGAALGGTKDGALAGALVGGVAGLAAVGVSNADTSPETARAAKELLEVLAKTVRQPPHGTQPIAAVRPALPTLSRTPLRFKGVGTEKKS